MEARTNNFCDFINFAFDSQVNCWDCINYTTGNKIKNHNASRISIRNIVETNLNIKSESC